MPHSHTICGKDWEIIPGKFHDLRDTQRLPCGVRDILMCKTLTEILLLCPRIDSLQSGRIEWSRISRRHHHGVGRGSPRNVTVGC